MMMSKIVRAAEQSLSESFLAKVNKGLDPMYRRYGGYLSVFDGLLPSCRTPILIAMIGNPIYSKIPKYMELSQEKGQRLLRHFTHRSSWQSRNPGRKKYGGAIRAGGYIFSFSGLPELGDEALMLRVAKRLGCITDAGAYGIARLSNNGIHHRDFRKNKK